MNFKKHFFLFLIFGLSVLVLLFPRTSLAVITGSGCETNSTVIYRTECGESKTIGSCSRKCCDTECCEWDEEGNCTDTCCVDRCWDCSCPAQSWNEYQCDSPNCDGDIKIRTCTVSKKGSCPSGCGNDQCCVTCGEWKTCEECGSWQKPIRESCECTKAGQNKPKCKCSGGCIAAPTGLRYYDNPNYPTNPCNPEPGEGSTNIKLPVKLDWDDVEGWKGGWCSGSGYELADACGNMTTAASVSPYKQCCLAKEQACVETKSAEINWDELTACERRVTLYMIEDDCKWTHYQVECLHEYWESTPTEPEPSTDPTTCGTVDCPYPNLRYNPSEMVQHYEITITGDMRDADGNAISNYSANLDQSEFIPPNPCFFKSNRTYTWSVRACCGSGGCGPAATSAFTTNLAPEPVWPYDPDWAGPDRAEPNWTSSTYPGYPVELNWCKVDEAVSFIVQAHKWGVPYCPEILCPYCPGCPMLFQKEGKAVPQDFRSFYFDLDSFTKETLYDWKIATCFDEYGKNCGDFGQLWKFFGYITLAKVELISPKDGECVNLSSPLEWKNVGGANSYIYEIDPVPALQNRLATSSVFFKDIWDHLALNTTYSWRVKSCWDEAGTNCEEGSWSDKWEFTTTGAAPTGLNVESEPTTGNALIPIKLNWDNMPCAASYNYEVALDSGFNNIIFNGVLAGLWPPASEISINYDPSIHHPKQGADYWWRVKTCADTEGKICGSWASGSFKTFTLSKPENPYPPDGGKFYTYEHYLKWDPVLEGAFYQYEIEGKINLTVVSQNNAFINTAPLDLGTYTWRVQACLDINCEEAGPFSDDWSFDLTEGEAPGKGGIVPCGRYTDNPDTPWNEREACGIQHIFIMIFSIINFLLWKVIPIVLALLAVASGVIFYFSGQLGMADPLTQIKSLWKAAGIGLVVIFLAWTGISLLLGLFGYQVGLFGLWWKIKF